jgi:hypothetical protein
MSFSSRYRCKYGKEHEIIGFKAEWNSKLQVTNVVKVCEYKFCIYGDTNYHFIDGYIDMLKETVFRKYKNIHLFKVEINGYEITNILHNLLSKVIEYIRNILRINVKKLDKNHLIIKIHYDEVLVYTCAIDKYEL